MHTAPVANLPIHPTPAVARHEFHDEDFTVHLREDARENSHYDEPRSPQHEESNPTEARPRAPEEDHQRLSPDNDTASVAQPENREKPTASQIRTNLPDSITETSDAVAALDQSTTTAQPLVPELVAPVADAVNPETTPARTSNPALSTAPAPALVIDGATEISVPAIYGEPEFMIAMSPETVAAGQPAITPATDIHAQPAIPATNVTPTTTMPAKNNVAGQSAAAAIVAASGVHGGSGIQGRTAGDAATTDRPSHGTTQVAETNGETAIIPGSTKKTAEIIPATAQAGQSAGTAVTSGTTAKTLAAAATSTNDMPALRDMAAAGNDMPAQTHAPGANQNSTTAAAFGSELRLAGDASPAAETAAARNTPNAAASQVAVQINRAVQDGQDKFIVNLKPGALGKISIQLEVGHDNRIIAVIAAERPETLELLQRDSRALELALKEAGLKADSGSLSFSLQGEGSEDSPFENQSESNHVMAVPQDGDDLDALATLNTHAHALHASGIDLHV